MMVCTNQKDDDMTLTNIGFLFDLSPINDDESMDGLLPLQIASVLKSPNAKMHTLAIFAVPQLVVKGSCKAVTPLSTMHVGCDNGTFVLSCPPLATFEPGLVRDISNCCCMFWMPQEAAKQGHCS